MLSPHAFPWSAWATTCTTRFDRGRSSATFPPARAHRLPGNLRSSCNATSRWWPTRAASICAQCADSRPSGARRHFNQTSRLGGRLVRREERGRVDIHRLQETVFHHLGRSSLSACADHDYAVCGLSQRRPRHGCGSRLQLDRHIVIQARGEGVRGIVIGAAKHVLHLADIAPPDISRGQRSAGTPSSWSHRRNMQLVT